MGPKSYKVAKTRSFNGQSCFRSIPVVAPLTPGTDDVRTSDAAQRLWKRVEYKIAVKFEMLRL